MPTTNIHVVAEPGTLEEAFEQLAKLQKTLRYLLNGQLDFENLRARSIKAENIEVGTLTAQEIAANTITADKMNVNELSAITANLGHILAGLIESVEIYGSYISTNRTSYPRAEMSNTLNMFRAMASAVNLVSIEAFNLSESSPSIMWKNGSDEAVAFLTSSIMRLVSKVSLLIGALSDVTIQAKNINLQPFMGFVNIFSWSHFRSEETSQTLQAALNAKANAFFGYSGSIETGDGKTAIFSNGILVGVV